MRAERRHPFGWVVLAAVMMWVAILLAFVGYANAQTGGFVFSPRENAQAHGMFIYAWNSTGTAIGAGTIVQADTATTGSVPQIAMGKGFKTWTGATADYPKIMGVLIDPAPAGNTWARVMVRGFIPYAKVMSGISAGSYLRPSFTAAGRFAAFAFSDSEQYFRAHPIGIFQRYNPDSLTTGYIWVDFSTP